MLIRRFIELLTPIQCLECGADGDVLCLDCRSRVLGADAVCFRCGLPSPLGRTCGACLAYTCLQGVSVGAYYDGAVKELILQLKFHRLRSGAEVAAELLLAGLPKAGPWDVVTSVPVSARRYRERGYNQAEAMARRVSARLFLPYTPLFGRTTSQHQLGVGRQTRLEQVKGAFYPLREARGQRVLVVDDVVTTGATLSECAEVLMAAGAESVWSAVVARH